MTAHVHLGLVFHQHQPVGNYGFVFDELFAKSYEPLLACLERHPGVKAGLHYSGPLLEWLVECHPEYVERIRGLVARGQVEMLGGGYYEPILPAISEADRLGQLRKMGEAIASMFGEAPCGMWLTERVWEPDLPRSIHESGYSWTLVDDVHFEATGLAAEEIDGWYLTESEGKPLGVFASSTAFRYLVPWGMVDDCIDFLRARGDRRHGGLVVMGDDGEKFGGWPTTFTHCWENGWVDALFSRLEAESTWIETVHLGTWRREHRPKSLVYLPATSYMEMGEWSLPPAAQHALRTAKDVLRSSGRDDMVRYLRGGHWRNFVVRYPEVNLLHKRLLLLSEEAHRQGNAAALDHIWRAQCNCAYWHGVFGGVYLEHIRHANFAHMAAADAALFPGRTEPDTRDWDFDGRDEVCLRSTGQVVVVDDDGAIVHWELREAPWHLTHVVARRPEAYHATLAAPAGQEGTQSIHAGVHLKDPEALGHLFEYDRGLRVAAQDTVVLTPEHDYRTERLANVVAAEITGLDASRISMTCHGAGATWTKALTLTDMGLLAEYQLAEPGTLYSEWNLSLPEREGGQPPAFEWREDSLTIETGRFRLTAAFTGCSGWHEHVFSASNTEGGVELQPQGWAIVFRGESARAAGHAMTIAWSIAPC